MWQLSFRERNAINLRDQHLIRPNVANSDHLKYALISSGHTFIFERFRTKNGNVSRRFKFHSEAMKQIEKQYLETDVCFFTDQGTSSVATPRWISHFLHTTMNRSLVGLGSSSFSNELIQSQHETIGALVVTGSGSVHGCKLTFYHSSHGHLCNSVEV